MIKSLKVVLVFLLCLCPFSAYASWWSGDWSGVRRISVPPAFPSLTQGSVLFIGPGGVLAEDNTGIFYDDTGNNLGLGVTTFGTNLAGGLAIGNGTAATAVITDGVQMWADDYAAGDSRLYIMGESDTQTVILGNGKIVLPSEDAAAAPSLAFGDGDTGFYEDIANGIAFASNGVSIWRWTSVDFRDATNGGPSMRNEVSTVSNPTFIPSNLDVTTGIGGNGDGQISLISGGVEAHRLTEASRTIESNASVCQDNSGLELKTVAAHSLAVDSVVQVADGTGSLCTGLVASTNYYVLAVGTTTTATLAASRGGSIIAYTDTGTAFTSYNLEITGNLYGDMVVAGVLTSTPTTFAFTTEIDITIASTVVLLDGDNDADNDAIDLQNGTTAGQQLQFMASADIDADDTVTINMADTTCTNCATIVFDKVGENATLTWTGSTWFVKSIVDAL